MRRKQEIARRRALLVLVGVLAGLIVGLGWWQARARRASDPAPFEQLLREFMAPSVRAAGGLRNTLAPDETFNTAPLTTVSQARLRALEEENRRLRAVLGLRDKLPEGALIAEVISRARLPGQGDLVVDKGTRDGVAIRMVAVTPEGVVGQVVDVSSRTARILPLTDAASHVAAMLERTKTPAILDGDREGLCRLVNLPGQVDVRAGDLVVTSGLGSIFPKGPERAFPSGLPLGRVIAITQDEAMSARTATVQPAVDLARVELVVLITRK